MLMRRRIHLPIRHLLALSEAWLARCLRRSYLKPSFLRGKSPNPCLRRRGVTAKNLEVTAKT